MMYACLCVSGHLVRMPVLLPLFYRHFMINESSAIPFADICFKFVTQHLHLLNVSAVERHLKLEGRGSRLFETPMLSCVALAFPYSCELVYPVRNSQLGVMLNHSFLSRNAWFASACVYGMVCMLVFQELQVRGLHPVPRPLAH